MTPAKLEVEDVPLVALEVVEAPLLCQSAQQGQRLVLEKHAAHVLEKGDSLARGGLRGIGHLAVVVAARAGGEEQRIHQQLPLVVGRDGDHFFAATAHVANQNVVGHVWLVVGLRVVLAFQPHRNMRVRKPTFLKLHHPHDVAALPRRAVGLGEDGAVAQLPDHVVQFQLEYAVHNVGWRPCATAWCRGAAHLRPRCGGPPPPPHRLQRPIGQR